MLCPVPERGNLFVVGKFHMISVGLPVLVDEGRGDGVPGVKFGAALSPREVLLLATVSPLHTYCSGYGSHPPELCQNTSDIAQTIWPDLRHIMASIERRRPRA